MADAINRGNRLVKAEMPTPSFVTRHGGETWIVTPAEEPILRRAAEPGRSLARGSQVRAHPHGFPDRLYQWEGFAPPPDDNAEPYTLQWFLSIEHERHARHARWIPELLEFAKHQGETLVGLGNGLGTDWLQYARHGAKVIACSPLAAELALIKRNFELRGLNGRFVHAEPHKLPLPDAVADVVCVSGLLHEIGDPHPVVAEIIRILKPGGKALAVVPAKYNIDFYRCWLTPWLGSMSGWLRGSPWRSAAEIPATAARSFSQRRLKKLFAGLVEHRIHQRQLRRREAPWVFRLLPRKLLERWFGRFLIFKAFKPVSAAPVQRAAA
jgi:SAM-dependent methyltransferase